MTQTTRSFPISDNVRQIEPFRVMKILGEAKKMQQSGRDIIHMEIGEPDFPSPTCVHTAAGKAAEQGLTHYTASLGLPELRNALSAFYKTFYQAEVDADNFMVTPGSSSALQLVLSAILNSGDRVLMADPTYPCNRQFVKLLNAEPILVEVDHTSRYQLNLQILQRNWQTGIKAVMVATPANPTGTLIEKDELLKMAQFLAEKQAYFIVDEIYQGLVYQRPAESILAQENLPDNVIVINSFSKFFGMTGWRLGWCVAPRYLIDPLDRLAQNLYLSAPTPSQYGALAALNKENLQELEQRRQIFEQRRDRLYTAMLDAGFKLKLLPQGAFYLYWDISDWSEDSESFCRELLQHTGVALTPGTDFSPQQGRHHVRLAYTTDETRLLEAVERIADYLQTRPQNNCG
ncbi:aminotransferase class I/II-fold pyridoxal phosphate-dependent enzyme [Thiomicrorhabdus sp.]|uniref:aminotransferase class I/II-fold pyridoxal phosphate-dependent enzyme n=1 Tax=Thiomicrorhabdus sp. TaxID=2039724 RepID=UPI0029C60805|nr:aminotransferase class I/II-fold pyridoxal phosphate-dependent enzyme [Thiomicrorhabdus sp.]